MSELRITNLRKTFGSAVALDGVTVDAADGELLTLLGPSGCGKSTTLWSIAGLHRPDSGSITVGDHALFDDASGVDLPPEHRGCGVVFQSYAIWPHLTVAGNVGYPLKLRKVKGAARRDRVAEVLDLVELGDFADRFPHQLSGGQQQRVALARALAHPPQLLLLDEPFSNLDAKLRERAREWLKLLQRELGVTTVFVTHDQDEALSMSDRIVVMDHGAVRQIGTPEEIYNDPADLFVADFIGTINLLDAQVTRVGDTDLDVQLDGHPAPLRIENKSWSTTGPAQLTIRPEAIEVHPTAEVDEPNAIRARVVDRAYLGDHYRYWVRVGASTLVVQSTQWIGDDELTITIPPTRVQLFPPDQQPSIDESEVAHVV